jgi:DNA-binding transcriptional regulator LsrR (DeoR family)
MFVHKVILSGRMIQVSSGETIGSVFAHKSLKVVHGEEFGVSPSGGVKENTEVSVDHFIISHD